MPQPTALTTLTITPVPAFQDNYLWTFHDERHAVVVDPGDAQPVIDYLTRHGLTLAAILVTHHHPDHVGGLPKLIEQFGCPVYGPAGEKIPALTQRLVEGETVTLAELGVQFSVMDVPGHTAGHIAYYGQVNGGPVVFCGDTLFACGCGRLFEGTPAQMHASLSKLMALPDVTQVYCTHEYTMSNIRFAQAVEPNNAALAARAARDADTRTRNLPTLPSSIGLEKATNPFVRWNAPEVVAAASVRGAANDAVSVFAAVREWKNNFK